MKQYKVIREVIRSYDPEKLEKLLNENSKNGFEYKHALKADRNLFLLIFEKEISQEG